MNYYHIVLKYSFELLIYLTSISFISFLKAVIEEIDRKTRDIFALTNKGIVAIFTNLPEFIKDIKTEVV